MSLAGANRLGDSLSPYLLQHADNPVHWQPWDQDALELAREHDVPILLSIGYASCHWCHVMERESFDDHELAELMNSHFVCIKLDREERPDLDKTFQSAHFLMSKRAGGWPLTCFLAPDLVPFFIGTYFPPQPRRGMPSFREVLARVSHVWRERRSEINEQNGHVAATLRDLDERQSSPAMPEAEEIIAAAERGLLDQFDLANGGLGKAPKFPQVPSLLFALERLAAGTEELRPGLERTLAAISCGGLHDHVGGGFFRYCVDPVWDIPHFEKMHYDNSLLIELFARASIELDEPAYSEVARSAARWLLAELRSADGGVFAAWDADSEGVEGKYYVWDEAELKEVLGTEGFIAMAERFNIAEPPNFEGGCHILMNQRGSYRPLSAVQTEMLGRLREARSRRVAPVIDDKVLASACGLAAGALARGGLLLGERGWIAAAQEAVEFAEDRMSEGGRLRTAWRDGQVSEAGFLDDHAYLLQARLNLLGAACTRESLEATVRQADTLLDLFDDGGGGLLFAAKDADQVLRRIRSCDDGPQPSGNAVAAECLLRLGWLLGREDYLAAAERIIQGFGVPLEAAPVHALMMAGALELASNPLPHAILTGEPEAVGGWCAALSRAKGPRCLILPVADPAGMPDAVRKPLPQDAPVWAHVCSGSVCLEPTSDLRSAHAQLGLTEN